MKPEYLFKCDKNSTDYLSTLSSGCYKTGLVLVEMTLLTSCKHRLNVIKNKYEQIFFK